MHTLTVEQLQECGYELDRRIKYLPIILSTPTIPTDDIGGIKLAQRNTFLSTSLAETLASQREISHKKRRQSSIFKRSELLDLLNEGNPI